LNWKFAESISDNYLDSVVDFTNFIETSCTNNITREVGITGALKFKNCKFENCNCRKRKINKYTGCPKNGVLTTYYRIQDV
jgi:hypothetical protein